VSRRARWGIDEIPDLSGRRALVTGVTSGVGEAVVEALAGKGAEVVMAARNEERLAATVDEVRRDVPGANVRPLILDLADLKSVRSAAEEATTFGPLDILVNNAGVMATPYERTVDDLELQMATNVFGHFALTGLLLPRLVEAGEAGGARVVSVASQGHRFARHAPLQDPKSENHSYSKWMTYAQTKLSNLLFTFELDRRARAADLPVDALAAHPGFAATGLMASGQRRNVAGRILDAAFGALGQAPAEGALPLLMAATADLPSTTYVGPGGPGEMRGAPKVVGTTKLARDPEAARQLWRIAEDVTGVVFP
jgi:NAD(P)-dependent dehydrogenase (short-subunit alcohol dehydrogenase family)